MSGTRRKPIAATGLAVLMLSLTMAGSAVAAPVASNDDFADAKNIGSGALPYVDEVDAGGAGVETGEPDESRCESDLDDDSIWYTIRPSFRGALRADTIGTDDGQITVYTGSSLETLDEVACNTFLSDDSSSARVTFKVSAGTRYYIRVTETNEHTVFHLRRVKRPGNDDFSDARQLTVGSLPLRERVSILNATYQYAEPDSADIGTAGCSTVDPSIWYTIRPTSTTNLRVTIESGIDTVVAVYRGDSLGSLTPIGCNDDTSVEGQGLFSNVAWRAFAGVRYYIQVGGYYGETTSRLSVVIAKGKPPANDNFANAETITANGALHHVRSTQDATMELGASEPDPSSCSLANTVWYRFTAPSSGEYQIDVFGTEFDTAIAVYTGGSLGSLSAVNSMCDSGQSMAFTATGGTTYRIQIGGDDGDSGDLHVHLRPVLSRGGGGPPRSPRQLPLSARWPFACFLGLGLFWGALAALIPDIKAQVGATDGELGVALLFVGVGAIPAMLLTGRLWRRFGWWLLPVGALLFATAMLPPIFAAAPFALAVSAALFGATSGVLDVSMNAAVSDVEAVTGRRLMFGAHALFSLGVFVAAIATGLARELGAEPAHVLVSVAVVTALIGLGSVSSARAARSTHTQEVESGKIVGSAARAITLLAALCAAAFLVEDAIQNWSALHLERGLGASPVVGGAAPGIYAGAMFIGRVLGQRIGDRLSERALLSGGAGMAAVGAALLTLAPSAPIALVGLAVAGGGISMVAPALFGAAGRLAGPRGRGAAIARVTSLGYSGFIFGPAVVGLIAQATDLRTALGTLALMALGVGVFGWLVMRGDTTPRTSSFEEGEELMKIGRA